MSERECVRGLVAKWRERADAITSNADYNAARRYMYEQCAAQLESALAAEGVQAGEVEQRARDLLQQLASIDDPAGRVVQSAHNGRWFHEDAVLRAIVAARSQQPEARGVVRHDLCGCPNGRAEHSPSCAALTEARNVR